VGGVIGAIALLVIAVRGVAIVDNGHVGIVQSFGAFTGSVLQPGLHFINPFTEGVQHFDLRNQVVQVEATAASKDLQNIKSDLTMTYRLDGAYVVDIFRSTGIEQLNLYILAGLQEEYKQTTGQYGAEDQLQKREEIRQKTAEGLIERLGKQHVLVVDFAIVNFDFVNDQFEQAIVDKQVAAQRVLKAEQEKAEAAVHNEQRVAQAEADKQVAIKGAEAQAEAQRLQQSSITPLLLQLELIRKWNGVYPQVLSGDGGGLLIQIPGPAPSPTPAGP
jgi:regulator of protease activity HflC (stomatin/prohibitin superfamily)